MEVFNVHFRSHEPVCSLFNQPAQGSFKSDIVRVYLSPLVLSLKMERGGDWRYMQMRQLVLAKNELSGTVPPCPLLPKHWDRSTTPFVLGMDNSCWHWVLLHNWSALWDLRKSFVHPTSPFFLAKKFSVLKIVEILPLKKLMIESVKVSEDRTSWHKKQDRGGQLNLSQMPEVHMEMGPWPLKLCLNQSHSKIYNCYLWTWLYLSQELE